MAQDQNNGKISDHAGIAFCQAFYRSLANMDSVRKAFDIGCAAARKEMRGEVGSDGQFILLPEDEDHDERIFSPIAGTFRETTRPPPPSNAPPPPRFRRPGVRPVCVSSPCCGIGSRQLVVDTAGAKRSGDGSGGLCVAAPALRCGGLGERRPPTASDDVAEAAAYVIQKAEDDHLNPMNKKMMHIKKRSTSIDTADTSALDTSILVDLASAGRVLVVLNDFENLVLNSQGVAAAQIAARERCVVTAGWSCRHRVLMTCSSGSGIGLVPGVTEQVVALDR